MGAASTRNHTAAARQRIHRARARRKELAHYRNSSDAMSTLRFYNTLSRSLDEFTPADPQNVGVYGCGPTVYRPPHIGNFRTFVFNDLLHRYLEWKGFGVKFVMN